ncbi:MAG: hypothetical protein R3B09_31635 [Nannocystaceae bacterium]
MIPAFVPRRSGGRVVADERLEGPGRLGAEVVVGGDPEGDPLLPEFVLGKVGVRTQFPEEVLQEAWKRGRGTRRS